MLFILGLFFYAVFDYFFPNRLGEGRINKEQAEEAKEEEARRFEERMQGLLDCVNSIPELRYKDKKDFYFVLPSEHHGQDIIHFDLNSFANSKLDPQDVEAFCNDLRTARIVDKENIMVTPEDELPASLQCHNDLHHFDGNFLNMKDKLEAGYQDGTIRNKDDLFCLAHIYEITGDYEKKKEIDNLICQKFNERCEGDIEVEANGTVRDGNNQPIQDANIEVLNFPEKRIIAQTDSRGNFKLNFKAKNLDKIRLKAWKRNFSDGIAAFYVLESSSKFYRYKNANFVLNAPISIVTIDNVDRTVTGGNNKVLGNNFIIKTSRTKYKIPMDAIIDRSGNSFKGGVDVYLYEFDRDTDTSSILTVDTFDQVMGYAGDIMKTYGMPYIQFFSKGGQELYIRKDNPMIITYKIPHMEELWKNTDQIYEEPLTKEDMEFLVDTSQKGKYPIDRKFLIENQMLRFPAFWAFDQKRGVWDNVGMSVLDTEGMVEIPWYTIRN